MPTNTQRHEMHLQRDLHHCKFAGLLLHWYSCIWFGCEELCSPVTRRPSHREKSLQSPFFSYLPPRAFMRSSSKNGTLSVLPTASSSVLQKPVHFLPLMMDLPSGPVASRIPAGPWHTEPITLPAYQYAALRPLSNQHATSYIALQPQLLLAAHQMRHAHNCDRHANYTVHMRDAHEDTGSKQCAATSLGANAL